MEMKYWQAKSGNCYAEIWNEENFLNAGVGPTNVAARANLMVYLKDLLEYYEVHRPERAGAVKEKIEFLIKIELLTNE